MPGFVGMQWFIARERAAVPQRSLGRCPTRRAAVAATTRRIRIVTISLHSSHDLQHFDARIRRIVMVRCPRARGSAAEGVSGRRPTRRAAVPRPPVGSAQSRHGWIALIIADAMTPRTKGNERFTCSLGRGVGLGSSLGLGFFFGLPVPRPALKYIPCSQH
jgi:hypothetical protein